MLIKQTAMFISLQRSCIDWSTGKTKLNESSANHRFILHHAKAKYYNHKNHHRLYPHNNHHDNNHHATLSHKESHLHLPGLRKLSRTFPGDDQAAAIQTVSICVTKYMGSHGCLALHGWARLHQLPNPFPPPSRLFSRQSYSESASSRRHAVQSFPAGL